MSHIDVFEHTFDIKGDDIVNLITELCELDQCQLATHFAMDYMVGPVYIANATIEDKDMDKVKACLDKYLTSYRVLIGKDTYWKKGKAEDESASGL